MFFKTLARVVIPVLFILSLSAPTFAQVDGAGIGRYFSKYDIIQFDTENLYEKAKRTPNDFLRLNFNLTNEYSWSLELSHSKIFSDNYIYKEGTKTALSKDQITNLPILLEGYDLNNNYDKATITINNGFLYGLIKTRSGRIYFEPLSTFDKDADHNTFIVYHENDVIQTEDQTCAATDHNRRSEEIILKEEENQANYRAGECLEVEYAIANDHWVYDSRGSSTVSWNAGVVANLNTDYDDAFSDEVRFVIVESYVSTETSEDLWGNTDDLLQLLYNFREWAPGGFNNSHDLGGIWSKNNYSGSTIGWASVGAVCTWTRYHSLRDFSNNANSVRNLVSHEIGHNFNCSHISSSGYIMSGSVSGTSTWNSSSIATVNSYLGSISCLSTCGGGPPPPPPGDAPVAGFGASLLQECNPTKVQFLDESTNDPTSWSWSFQSGTPTSSSLQNPIVEYPGGGEFRVTLTATNEHGSDDKILIMTLNVGDGPTAGFSHSVSGFTANFSNTSSNADSYTWDFGDGNTSFSTNPSHSYASPGTYTVELIAGNDCGQDTEEKVVTIIDQVTAAFSANTTITCEGESIQFNNESSSNVTSFFWEFEGGTPSTSTAENPLITYNGDGFFNVKLTVENSTSTDVENKINYIQITTVPNTSFTYIKNGLNVEFDNNTLNGTAYNWDFGDGNTSTSSNPTHSYSSAGTYLATLVSSNSCGSEEFSQTIVIQENVTASFESSSMEGCEGQTVTFASTSTGDIDNYFWEFEGGTPITSTALNPTITYNNKGLFNVKLTVSNETSEDSENKINHINIGGDPTTSFTYIQNDFTFDFDNNTVGGFTYSWDFGDGNTSISANPSHTYEAPGIYTVSLYSENDCGGSDYAKIIEINEILVADFNLSSDFACEGQTISFENSSIGEVVSYFWEFEGGIPATSAEENPIVQYNNSGEYNVKLTVESIYGTIDIKESTNLISVSKFTEADFSYVQEELTINLTNLSTNVQNMSWDFGDGNTSSEASPTHTYLNEGDYIVKLTVSNQCGFDIKEIIIPVYDQLLANFQASETTLCPGDEVQLLDLSSGNPTQWEWIIEGNSMVNAEEQNPVLHLMESGSYNVELTVSNNQEEHTKMINSYIEVMPTTQSNFSYNQEELEVSFTPNSPNAQEFYWDFGDGNNSNEIAPNHIYQEEGNYLVTLEVGNDCNTSFFEIEIPVFNQLIAGFGSNSTVSCVGNEINFEDQSSGNATSWLWTFPGGTPEISTEQNPVVQYMEPGTYDVILKVNSENEEVIETRTGYIEVIENQSLEILSTQNEYYVEFSSNQPNALEYYWDFGDGGNSNKANPTNNYQAEGYYDVKLITSNECGFDTSFIEIKVQAEIIAEFDYEANEICPGEVVNFLQSNSPNVISWEWSFPGGYPETSSEEHPSIQYNETGQYNVELKLISLFDEKIISLEKFISVLKNPIANFEYEVNKDSVRFFNISENGSEYLWVFDNDDESSDLSPIHIFEEETSYEVSLIAINNCSRDTITKVINLYDEADIYANFSLMELKYCIGDSVSFIDLSSDDITEWNWSFQGATPAISSEKNPKIIYNDYGSFDVELTVSNGFNSRTIMLEDYITIVDKPVANFELEQAGNEIFIENLSSNGETLLWLLGDGTKSTIDISSHLFDKNGIYSIELIVSNSCGTSEKTSEVEIDVYPKAGFSLDLAQGCAPLIVNFENRSTENADEVTWVLEGLESPIINENNPQVEYLNPGNYGIMVIAQNSYGSDTISLDQLIEVWESPNVSFDFINEGLTFEFTSEIQNYDEFIWNFGDETSSSELNPTHVYESSGEYEVILIASKGECSVTFTEIVSAISTSIPEIEADKAYKVYPNPSSGNFTIDFDKLTTVQKVEVLDIMGQLLESKSINQNTDKVNISLVNNLPTGNYIISVYSNNENPIFHKLIISN